MTEPRIKDKETMAGDYQESVPIRFCQLTHDVLFFTGLENTRIFQTLFNYLQRKASLMTYCNDSKNTLKPRKGSRSIELTETLFSSPDIEFTLLKPGPKRKVTLEQEFLHVLMKLSLGITIEDLAFRFKVTPEKVSLIFITWIKPMSKELSVLVIWPSSSRIESTFPIFSKSFPIICESYN